LAEFDVLLVVVRCTVNDTQRGDDAA